MNNKIKLIIILFISIVQMSCKEHKNSTPQSNTIEVLTPQEFKEKSENQIIIDVRTPGEFKQGYIKGAVNINYFDDDFLEKMSKYNKNTPLYIYCRSGNRSESASEKLEKIGFKKIYDLQGGILKWVKNNYETVK